MAGLWALRIDPADMPDPQYDPPAAAGVISAATVLAGGCFWCTEAVFKELDGVAAVRSGYAGGSAETANYDAVCSGATDHAEVIEVQYNPTRTSFGQLLKILFSVAHDPTQINRQGNDRGRQYRSAVFYADEQQYEVTKRYIAQLEAAKLYSAPIKTALEPLTKFYVAETYHQNFAARNPRQGYVMAVAKPKVAALRESFGAKLKSAAKIAPD
ncbi:MAG: peptide-methionine (S)-S-oxide reductase [Alphaproteobacteria bacterium]|nr:peptide-methionine (S)-S-oxide reductase [Alphaproteobacteria bacterium]